MRRFNDPLPPVQRRGGLAGCWVRDGEWGHHYYAGALLPDGGPCLVRASVEIDPSPDRAVPYRLAEWVVYVGERGIRWQGDGPATA